MEQWFIQLAIFLLPLQVLSLFLMGSRYDLSAFIALALAVAVIVRRGMRPTSAAVLVGFTALHVVLFAWFGIAPFYRVVSGVVWLGGLLYFLLEGDRLVYRQHDAYRVLVGVLGVSAMYIFIQVLVGVPDRPKAWFHEPSFAGLCLYGAAAGVLTTLIVRRTTATGQLAQGAFFVFLFAAALLTFSMHVVTFVVTLGTLGGFELVPRLLRLGFLRFRLRTAFIGMVILTALTFIVIQLSKTEHFASRVDFANPTNFSLLSWLRGLDQMVAATKHSSLFGMGLGSTGFFEFQSRYSDILAALGRPKLNLTDAYSLAFRLVIEIGLPIFVMFLIYLSSRVRAFIRFLHSYVHAGVDPPTAVVFNFVFAITVISGCLLKEPLYPQSFLYVAVLLLSSIPLTEWRGRPRLVQDVADGANVAVRSSAASWKPEE
jgi:hypothetical protein